MLLFVGVILAGLLQTICLLFGVSWIIQREKRRASQAFNEAVTAWFTPPDEGKPSKFAEVLDAAGSVVGSAAARSIMASLNADKSHAARVANGIADEAQGASNPLLGLLAGGRRGKNAALASIAQMILPMLSGAHGGNGNGATDDVTQRIWKG